MSFIKKYSIQLSFSILCFGLLASISPSLSSEIEINGCRMSMKDFEKQINGYVLGMEFTQSEIEYLARGEEHYKKNNIKPFAKIILDKKLTNPNGNNISIMQWLIACGQYEALLLVPSAK